MKIRMMPVGALAAVVALVSFSPTLGSAQQLQSGALLTIKDSTGTTIAAIYDSQIHSGTVQTDVCDAAVVTDAYVLQGGSPTGCDNGDAYEVTDNNENVKHQFPGKADISGPGFSFHIETHYLLGSFCNTANTICANPDTGFLTVTNTSTSAFAGTITLTGTSPTTGGDCPPTGTVSDSYSAGLSANGGFVTLALSTDSSNCGGFNASQTATLTPKGTAIFHIGPDDYELAAANNVGGETLTLDLVPVLQSSSNPGHTASNTFSPGGLFASDNCNAYASLSETGNPVCPEFHLSCSVAADCSTFAYKVTTDYSQPTVNSFDPGTPVFLKADGAICPPPGGFDENIFLFYTTDTAKGGGGSGLSCFAPAYGSGSPQTTPVSLPGYASKLYPPNPPAVTNWEEFCFGLFCPIPVIWQEFDLTNKLVTKNRPPFFSGGFCKSTTALTSCLANSVALQFVPLDCTTLTVSPTAKAVRADALPDAVIFNPFNDTFAVNAIPLQKKFDDTCQVLQLIITGTGGVQSTYSSYIHFD